MRGRAGACVGQAIGWPSLPNLGAPLLPRPLAGHGHWNPCNRLGQSYPPHSLPERLQPKLCAIPTPHTSIALVVRDGVPRLLVHAGIAGRPDERIGEQMKDFLAIRDLRSSPKAPIEPFGPPSRVASRAVRQAGRPKAGTSRWKSAMACPASIRPSCPKYSIASFVPRRPTRRAADWA
jgi:hypothetical protein